MLQVCPEKGLTDQHFRCDNCNRAFNQPPLAEARLCDYSGLYYCSECHQNGLSIIPARVLHNWDFTPRKVCFCVLRERVFAGLDPDQLQISLKERAAVHAICSYFYHLEAVEAFPFVWLIYITFPFVWLPNKSLYLGCIDKWPLVTTSELSFLISTIAVSLSLTAKATPTQTDT